MKQIAVLFSLLASFIFAGAQTPVVTQIKPEISDFLLVKKAEFDFGKIPQGKPVYTFFEVMNTGTEPLKLDNVQASCGCTTPEWNHEAIAPGSTAIIKVGYNAAADGYFEKPITITYNTSQSKQLKIKGIVWKAPVGSAPANASVQFLKQQTL
jgi:uncharacterized protein DUF1573